MTDATGIAAPIDPDANYTSPGFRPILGFFDGISALTGRVEGISGDVADISSNLTDARRAPWELRRDQEQFENDEFLDKIKVQRGDNKIVYFAAAAAAVAIVVVMS